MAGYKIEFNGSLNERRDVAEVTTATSLSNLLQDSPNTWDNFTVAAGLNTTVLPSPVVDAYRGYRVETLNTISIAYAGGATQIAYVSKGGNDRMFAFVTRNLPLGAWDYAIRLRLAAGATGTVFISSFNSARTGLGSTLQIPNLSASFQEFSGSYTATAANPALYFRLTGVFSNTIVEVDYLRITQGAAVGITPSTPVPGAAPTPGTPTVETITTIQDGVFAVPGPPKLFGGIVNHNGLPFMDAKYLPPADNAQDAELSLCNTEIITADTTTLSVDAKGLSALDLLVATDTSLIVKEYADAIEGVYPITTYSLESMYFTGVAPTLGTGYFYLGGVAANIDTWAMGAWYKHDLTQTLGAINIIATTGDTGGGNGSFVGLDASGNLASWKNAGPIVADMTSTKFIADGNWHHIVATCDGGSGVRYHVDGVFITNFVTRTLTDVIIGGGSVSADNPKGWIANVDYFGVAFNDTTVTTYYNLGEVMDPVDFFPSLGSNALASFRMGDDPLDTSGNLRDVVSLTNITVSNDPVPTVFDSPPNLGFSQNAMYFDNTTFSSAVGNFESAAIPAGPSINTWTLSAWYKRDSTQALNNRNIILSTGDESTGSTVSIGLTSGGVLATFAASTYPSVAINNSTIPINDADWHNVVLTGGAVNGTYIYMDGVLLNNGGSVLPLNYLTIGSYNQETSPKGWIGHVDVFKAELTAGQVLQLYNNGDVLNPAVHQAIFGFESVQSYTMGDFGTDTGFLVQDIRQAINLTNSEDELPIVLDPII